MNKLYIVRGLPGSGKSTLAESICEHVFAADDFFIGDDGVYRYNPRDIKKAHAWCRESVKDMMKTGADVAVANTFTREWEMEEYFNLASEYGYMVFTMIAENRHGGKNIHGVLEKTIEQMKNRFEVVL